MPEKRTLERARRAKREGKKPTTQAGSFVAEEMRHAKSGKHPVKSRKQAIAIGLSKARRSGVKVPRKKASSRRKAAPAASRRKTSGARKTARSRRSRSKR